MDHTSNSSELDRLRRILEESNVSSVSSGTSAANGLTDFASYAIRQANEKETDQYLHINDSPHQSVTARE